MKTEVTSGNTTTYNYDSRGNRISVNNGGIISQYTYDTNNRLLSQIEGVGESVEKHSAYTYDNNGNLLMRNTQILSDGTGNTSALSLEATQQVADSIKDSMLVMYTYNSLNQLTKIESDDTLPISYLYDADGRRIRKTIGDAVTNHVWDGQNIVYESDGNDNQIAKYIRGNKLIAQVTDTQTSYYTYDAHGSVTAMDGTVYTYDAFGNLQNDTDTYNPFRYSGEYYDAETDMIYLRNRYYEPSVGRFITEDPARDGLNWYVYCENNPVMFVDPLGLARERNYREDQTVNAFGRMITPQAATLTNYYYQQALNLTQSYVDQRKAFDEKYVQESNRLNTAIDDVLRLDDEGAVAGTIYDVPLYNQGNYNLCWAFSQTMIESYFSGEKLSQVQAKNRAVEIAKSVHGENSWNHAGWPTNSMDVINQKVRLQSVESFTSLTNLLSSGPVYGYYNNSPQAKKVSAHLIVITGVVSAPGHSNLVLSNNPQGDANTQTYNDFMIGIPKDSKGMKFVGALRV